MFQNLNELVPSVTSCPLGRPSLPPCSLLATPSPLLLSASSKQRKSSFYNLFQLKIMKSK